ncbi:MAG TPA: FeoB-associated Cys-rich membrane protein [Syntrophales bacterium]|jgi:hypothetical protein|nr:FeoB-associated Cys-rich membrane protein [Syntrophales bacterium]
MMETILVVGVVAAVALMAVRSFYRTMTGKEKGHCCGCANCTCGQAGKENAQAKPGVSA